MKEKICKDSNCNRSGQLLSLSEFPRDRRSKDGRYMYCLVCSRRRSRAQREREGAREYRKRELGIDRKPMVLSSNIIAFNKVYDAVNNGCRTREEIRRETKLDYDEIGDALALWWEIKRLRPERLPDGRRVWVPYNLKAA